jgi:hypothetical protein
MYTNIGIVNRVLRMALSLGLVFTILSMSGPLGALVYLPFVSIYAGLTAFIGWDPVHALLGQVPQQTKSGHHHHTPHGGVPAH